MGKDKEGKYHPRKGRPSGALREGVGVQSLNTSALEEHLEIAEKYTGGVKQGAICGSRKFSKRLLHYTLHVHYHFHKCRREQAEGFHWFQKQASAAHNPVKRQEY